MYMKKKHQTCTLSYTHTHTHTHKHTHTHTYTYIHTDTHTQEHTHIQSNRAKLEWYRLKKCVLRVDLKVVLAASFLMCSGSGFQTAGQTLTKWSTGDGCWPLLSHGPKSMLRWNKLSCLSLFDCVAAYPRKTSATFWSPVLSPTSTTFLTWATLLAVFSLLTSFLGLYLALLVVISLSYCSLGR